MEAIIIKALKWLLGLVVLLLIPVVFPIALIAAAIYHIPMAIGGWIYEKVEKYMEKR